VVLRLDFAAGGVAKRVRLECSLGHTFFLLLVLGRTPLWSSMAR
jgi:hypothetical protein